MVDGKIIINELDKLNLVLNTNSQLYDIMVAVELSKLLDNNLTKITLNEDLPLSNLIKRFFKSNKIKFCSTSGGIKPSRFDIHFGIEAQFQDIFILAAILKLFGLDSIFFSENTTNEIFIGSYITESTLKYQKNIDEGLTVQELLQIPFHTSTEKFLINNMNINVGEYFKNRSNNKIDRDDNSDQVNSPYVEYKSSYEKYGGYNGYSDNVIDDAFEGDPMNTWNVD